MSHNSLCSKPNTSISFSIIDILCNNLLHPVVAGPCDNGAFWLTLHECDNDCNNATCGDYDNGGWIWLEPYTVMRALYIGMEFGSGGGGFGGS